MHQRQHEHSIGLDGVEQRSPGSTSAHSRRFSPINADARSISSAKCSASSTPCSRYQANASMYSASARAPKSTSNVQPTARCRLASSIIARPRRKTSDAGVTDDAPASISSRRRLASAVQACRISAPQAPSPRLSARTTNSCARSVSVSFIAASRTCCTSALTNPIMGDEASRVQRRRQRWTREQLPVRARLRGSDPPAGRRTGSRSRRPGCGSRGSRRGPGRWPRARRRAGRPCRTTSRCCRGCSRPGP